jgi:hypothetical protein
VQLVDEQDDVWPSRVISFSTFFSRSSNSPRYFAPATRRAEVERQQRLSFSVSGTSPA